jgi:surfactin family lipopeptide synthetase A
MLTAFALLLYKKTAAHDFSIMVPVHNRNEKELEDVVGLLTNVVLVRMKIYEEWSIKYFITNCRAVILKAMQHQKYPFEKSLGLWIEHGGDTGDLMTSFFGYHDNNRTYKFAEAVLRLHVPLRNKENLPLSAAVFQLETGLTLRLSSAAGVFDQRELNKMSLYYFAILQMMTTTEEDTAIASIMAHHGTDVCF